MTGEERLASAGGPRVRYNAGRHKQDVPALDFYGGTSENAEDEKRGARAASLIHSKVLKPR